MLTNPEYAHNLGVIIKRKREAKKMSLDDLALALSMTKNMVEKLEKGEAWPTLHVFFEVARKFDVEPWALLLEARYIKHPDASEVMDFIHVLSRVFMEGPALADQLMRLVEKIAKSSK